MQKLRVHVVVDYTQTLLLSVQSRHRHDNDCVKPLISFDSFSLTLKEQSGEKSIKVCIHAQ